MSRREVYVKREDDSSRLFFSGCEDGELELAQAIEIADDFDGGHLFVGEGEASARKRAGGDTAGFSFHENVSFSFRFSEGIHERSVTFRL